MGSLNLNAKQVIAAIAVFTATGSAGAADNGIFVEHANVPSTKTLAEVRGEAVQAARNQSGRAMYFGG